MKKRVYIETSVISYLTARPSRNILAAAWQQLTFDWWERQRVHFDLFISELVVSEASRGDSEAVKKRLEKIRGIADLEITQDVILLANKIIQQGGLPKDALNDALHLAVSAVHGIDYLLTWNCRHLDNAEKKPLLRSICGIIGFNCPEICTPQELMGENNHV
jgi:predicted nucleic acid-binding protein